MQTGTQIVSYPGLTTGDGSWTWRGQTPQGNDLYDMVCADATHCYAASPNGSFGGLLKTQDFGSTWTYQSTARFYFLTCVNATTCMGIGDSFGITTTANSTGAWKSLPTMSGNAIACSSLSTCWVAQNGGYVYSTTDGGNTWTGSYTGAYITLHGISCIGTNCWAVGDSGRIVHTADGVNWTAQTSGSTQVLARITCVSLTSCWAAGWNGTILHTSDGGTTWAAQTSGTVRNFNGITCPGATTCYASGDNVIDKTTDGTTWVLTTGQPIIYRAVCTSTTVCMFVGPSGVIEATTDGGTTFTAKSSQVTTTPYNLHGVSCDAATDCYASGDQGTILHTADGVLWTAQTPPAGPIQNYYAVSCPTFHNCFMVGSNGTIIHTSDGSTWAAQTSGTTDWMYGLSCADASHCSAESDSGHVYHTVNGGTTWTQQTPGALAYYIFSITCPTTTICYVGGWNAVTQGVYKTMDGGTTWKFTPIGDWMYTITCPATNNCYAIGYNMWHTTDGGASWYRSNYTGIYWYGAIACLNVSTCIETEAYYQPTMYLTTDSGAHMSTQSNIGSQRTIKSIAIGDAGHVYGVGDGGVIFSSSNAFNVIPCKTTWMGVDNPIPQPYGTATTFNAYTWGCPTQPLYEFWVYAGGTWTMVQSYSTKSSWTWDASTNTSFPNLAAKGTYSVVAWIKASGSSPAVGYDTFGATSVSFTGCDMTTTTPNPIMVPTAGPAINVNVAAQGTGCVNPQYKVYVYNAGTGWVTYTGWTPGSGTDGTLTYGIPTGPLANGPYSLDIHAVQGNEIPYPETWGLSTMVVGAAPCNYVPTVAAAEGNPVNAGATIHFTASVGTSPCSAPLYRYYIYGPQAQWILLRDYTADPTLTLDTSSFNWGGGVGLQPGTYSVDVHIKQATSTAVYDTYALLSLSLRGCFAGSGYISQNPVPATKAIGIYASATCGNAQFRYLMQTPAQLGTSNWTTLLDWSGSTYYYFDTTGAAPGNYLFKTEIKNAGSPQAYDTFMLATSSVVSG